MKNVPTLVYEMVNTMVQQKEAITKEIGELTPAEHKKLITTVLGHGKKKKFANLTGLKYKTLERIVFVGRGEISNIEKIRRQLEAAK